MKQAAGLVLLLVCVLGSAQTPGDAFVREHNVAVPMRDGVVLRADVWRPFGAGPFPTLIYRTPYGKDAALRSHSTFHRAVERGYAVVIQDVRGRYESEGDFVAYRNEGRDGYDTIEWAARQPWSNGRVGTFGLSYPGAVQWLAAVESPPHLVAMVPAMTFSSPARFVYFGGVFDRSWLSWTWDNIAPNVRLRRNLPGPKTGRDAAQEWQRRGASLLGFRPLADLPDLKSVAPWYYEWMEHPPGDPWWNWCELRGKYGRVSAAVLNLSGWYDEAYGPEGAITNFTGLVASRSGQAEPRTHLLMGPWTHGETGKTKFGEREMGPAAAIDYDEVILRWMDHYLRGIENGVEREKRVRAFLMADSRWLESDSWPLPAESRSLYFGQGQGRQGVLTPHAATHAGSVSFLSDPAHPVTDPFPLYGGPHDYRELLKRTDLAVFETQPLSQDLPVLGAMQAEVYLSTDAPDTDLWVRVMDVAPDGTAFTLDSPGAAVIRASYRNGGPRRQLLQPGKVYKLIVPNIFTGNTFQKGHRLRVLITTAFAPHFSQNLHSGDLEFHSARMQTANITVHYGARYPSRLLFPVLQGTR